MTIVSKKLASISLICMVPILIGCGGRSGGSTDDSLSSSSGLSASISGDGALTAQAPSTLSVVPNSSQLSSSISGEPVAALPLQRYLATGAIRQALAAIPDTSTTDYENDQSEIWSTDPTKERFQDIDNLLKFLNTLGYEYVYGQGAVISIVDLTALDNMGTRKVGPQQTKEIIEVTVRSKLSEGNTLPLTIEAWGSQDGSDESLKVIIYEAPSLENRFGKFEAWQKSTMDFGGSPFSQERYIKIDKSDSGLLELTMVDSYGDSDYSGKYWAVAELNDETQTGQILMGDSNAGAECSSSGFINYNKDYVYQKYSHTYPRYDGSPGCESFEYEDLLDRSSIRTEIWSYGLYDETTESRKNLRTGLMVETEDGQYEGWASEWGLYMYPKEYDPNNNGMYTVSDGDILKEVSYDGSAGDTFTAKAQDFQVDQSITLATPINEIDGLALQLSTWNQQTNASTYFEIKWDKNQSTFLRTKAGSDLNSLSDLDPPVAHFETVQYAKINQSNEWENFIAELTFNFSAEQFEVKRYCKVDETSTEANACDSDGWQTPSSTLTFKDEAGHEYPIYLYMNTQSYSGDQVNYVWRSDTPSSIDVTLTERLKNLNDEIILVDIQQAEQGENNCNTSFWNAQDWTDTDYESVTYTADLDGHVYKLDTNLSLRKCEDNDCSTSTEITTGPDYSQWNSETNEYGELPLCTDSSNTSGCITSLSFWGLVPKDEIVIVTLNNPDDANTECQKFQSDRFEASYSANKDIYNQRVILMQGNQPFVFDTPMKFAKVANGKSYDFEYGGFGQLWIPWDQLDPSCEEDYETSTFCDWGPAFMFDNGDILTHKTSAGVETNYLVKQLFGTEIMDAVNTSETPFELKQIPELSFSLESIPQLVMDTQPQATKTCIVEGRPVDADGNPLSSITGDNASKFCQ